MPPLRRQACIGIIQQRIMQPMSNAPLTGVQFVWSSRTSRRSVTFVHGTKAEHFHAAGNVSARILRSETINKAITRPYGTIVALDLVSCDIIGNIGSGPGRDRGR